VKNPYPYAVQTQNSACGYKCLEQKMCGHGICDGFGICGILLGGWSFSAIPAVTYCFYPEEQDYRKDVGFNLMSCTPNVLLVPRICG
jgi:hypothetical protein